MGRNARLRRQRRDEVTSSRPSLFTPLANTQAELSQKRPSRPWWKKLLGKSDDQPGNPEPTSLLHLDLRQFYAQYAIQIGAVAWEGYQSAGRGFVWVKEQESSFDAEFFPRRQAAALLNEQQVSESDQDQLTTLIKSYDPRSDLVLVFTDPDDRMSAAHLEKLDPNPMECYRRKQESAEDLNHAGEESSSNEASSDESNANQTDAPELAFSDHQDHPADDQP